MFQSFLKANHITEKKIAVGVSGGSDSLALALMLQEELSSLGYKIVALTVDHGLRPSSSKEAEYVSEIMKAHDIEHHTLVWEGEKPQTGIEEAARTKRYALILDWCHQNGFSDLMLAHHMNDQAETFLMNMFRGSGLDGLCGMKEVSEKENIKILRPLLHTHPDVMKKYLQNREIAWVNDESNADDNFLRVKIRNFLPIMQEKIGISAQDIAETMSRLQTSQSFIVSELQKKMDADFSNWFDVAYSCPKDAWETFDFEMKFRLLSYLLKKTGKDSP